MNTKISALVEFVENHPDNDFALINLQATIFMTKVTQSNIGMMTGTFFEKINQVNDQVFNLILSSEYENFETFLEIEQNLVDELFKPTMLEKVFCQFIPIYYCGIKKWFFIKNLNSRQSRILHTLDVYEQIKKKSRDEILTNIKKNL